MENPETSNPTRPMNPTRIVLFAFAAFLALPLLAPPASGETGDFRCRAIPSVEYPGKIDIVWNTEPGWIYYPEFSDSLEENSWIPAHDFSGNKPGGLDDIVLDPGGGFPARFCRIHRIPENGDADGDRVKNLAEVNTLLTDPLLADTDGNGTSDYDEDRDSDGWSDGLEVNQGTDHETVAEQCDSDGDGLLDVDDADPGDPAIDWERTRRSPYAWVPLDGAPSDPGAPVMVNDVGHVLFEKALWVEGSWHMLDLDGAPFNADGPGGDPENMATIEGCRATFLSENDEILGTGSYVVSGGPALECAVFWSAPSAKPVAAGRSDSPPPVEGNSVFALAQPGAVADGKIWLLHWKSSSETVLAEYSVQDAAAALVGEHSCAPGVLGVVDALGPEVLVLLSGDACALFDGSDFTVLSDAPHSSWPGNLCLLPTGRPGVAANEHLWVRGADASWSHSKSVLGAIRIDGRGNVLAGYGAWLWRNGRTHPFSEMFPRVLAEGYDGINGIDMNNSGAILMEAYDASGGGTVAALAIPLEFSKDEAEAGFDDFERLLEETDISRPWLALPGDNEADMQWEPAHLPLDTGFDAPPGKLLGVLPALATASPVGIDATDHTVHDPEGPGYDAFFVAGVSRTLGLSGYPSRTVKLAVHQITLVNDDEAPEYSYSACLLPGKAYPAGTTSIGKGNGKPDSVCIAAGSNGVLNTTSCGGDDHPSAVSGVILTGKNGICETTAAGDDAQPIPPGQGKPGVVCVGPGPNEALETRPNEYNELLNPVSGSDDLIDGETITTGPNGIRDTNPVCPESAPRNVPTQSELEEFLERVFGAQANIHFTITQWNENVPVAYDCGDQDNKHPDFPRLAQPNGKMDFFYGDELSPEENLVRAAAFDPSADFNLYFFGSPIAGHMLWDGAEIVRRPAGFSRHRELERFPYIGARSWGGIDIPVHKIKHAAAHEIAHQQMNNWSRRGLHHPRASKTVDGQEIMLPYNPEKNYTLRRESDDRRRLMWPILQDVNPETGRTPILLLKSECDDMHRRAIQP